MMRPSPPARARAPVIGVRQPPARKLANLTAVRVLRTLEVLVFHAASPPRLAATMGIHDRTARRLLHALEDEGYLQRSRGNCRQRYTYSPTPRLLALAGQLAARLPLVSQGMQAVHQLRRSTGFDAYLVVPSYGDVIVLAAAGDHAPALWSLLPATDSAGGSVLLAYRQSWAERAQERARRTTPRCDDDVASLVEARAADVRRHGYAINTHGIVTSLAVPVPNEPAPLAALVLSSETPAPGNNDREAGDVASTLEAVDDAGGAAGRELQLARELAGRQLARPRKVLNGQYLRLREAESSGQRGAVARRLG